MRIATTSDRRIGMIAFENCFDLPSEQSHQANASILLA